MSEINKRILVSLFLFFLMYLSIINTLILSLILIFIFYQSIYEAFNILKRIFPTENTKLYLLTLVTIIYILLFSLIIYIPISSNDFSQKIIIFIIISISIGSDIGGYLFGKTFKGKKITKISPNKTYSGVFGSYFLSIFFIFFLFNDYYTYNELFFFVILLSTISQLGDLFISFLKRKAFLKNTGSILPGHGGILDRIDGLIFSLPLGFFFITKFV